MAIIYIPMNLFLAYYMPITMSRGFILFQKGESKNMTF